VKLGATETIKFKKLKMRLGVPHWQAVGLLESLWRFAERNSPLGDIGRHPNDDIAAAIEWSGSADELIAALVECRWLDVSEEYRLVVHDWSDHMPTWLVGNLKRHGKTAVDREPTKQPTKQVALQATKQPTEQPAMQPPSIPSDTKPSDVNTNTAPQDEQPDEHMSAQVFVHEWNLTPGVVLCRKVTPNRVRSFVTRNRDPTWDWRSALGKFPLKCFGEDDWKPDVDWFLRPDSVLKILEGKYDWSKSNGGSSNPKSQTKFESNISALESFARRHEGHELREIDSSSVCLETDDGLHGDAN